MTDSDEDLRHSVDRLTQEVERLNTHRFVTLHNTPWKLIRFQVFRGMAFGFGSIVGATLVVSVITWWIAQIEFIPVIGDWAREIIDQIETGR